jgi:nucleoside-diphosphate-sugar epimerase
MATVLVTGAAGFIGSHITSALLAAGHDVRLLDNLTTGHRANIEPMLAQVDFRQADLNDAEAVASACKGVEIIFHEAAIPSVPRSVADPVTSHHANLQGTFSLLEAARQAGVRRIVYAASSSAYGNQPGFPRVETMRPEPVSPYAVQKQVGELYLQSYWRVYGLETVCLRYFNIFGPRQDPNSPYSGVIARFAMEMLAGRTPTIFGDGGQSRDFTYVDNVVSANLLAASAPADRCAGNVYNVACGEARPLTDVYWALAKELDFHEAPVHLPPRAGDVRDSLADISRAQQDLGYTPLVGFEEGLARTAAWYRSQR